MIIMFIICVLIPKAIHSDSPTKMIGIAVSAILLGIGKYLVLNWLK